MSLLNYFVPKKVAGSAPTVVVITNNDSSRNTGGDVSSSSDDDPVYVEVVEKTQKILAARNLGQGVIDVDRSSVSGVIASTERQPIAPPPEPPRPSWSQRITPQSSSQVLGNKHVVGELLSWLKAWKKRRELAKEVPEPLPNAKRQKRSARHAKKKKKKKRGKKANVLASSSSSNSDDSDDDEWANADPDFLPDTRQVRNKARGRKRARSDDEDDWLDEGVDINYLCNMVLVTGPHGCGKTAAVFACAQELGYEVMEVNSSAVRSGKQVMSLLQEATQSHQMSQKNSDTAGNNIKTANAMRSFFKPLAAQPKVTKPASPSPAGAGVSGFAGPSLILFEEVDVLFEEDKGFWSALESFAESSKRPIVLTSVGDCMPPGLQYLSFPMEAPPQHLVSAHLYDKSKELHQAMSSVTRDSIACGVAACNGDLRRSVLEFEVWITTGQKKDIKPMSFESWTSPLVDRQARLAVDFARTRQRLVERSLSSEEVSPLERNTQLATTADLLGTQSVVDTLVTRPFPTAPRPAAHIGLRPPALSWQPTTRSWWAGTIRPGLVDTVRVEESDTIVSSVVDNLSIDIATALADLAVIGSTSILDATPSSDFVAMTLASDFDKCTDSGLASGGEESLSSYSPSSRNEPSQFSTLSRIQDEEFHARREFYTNCLRWPDMPDSLACQARSLAIDYLPMMREVCRHQQIKKGSRVKRRFIHHFSTMDDEVATRLAQDHLLA